MKTQISSLLLALALCAAPSIVTAQALVSLTTSPTGTTALYDDIVSKLSAQHLMELGWTFHAAGAAQPTGLLSIGLYPDRAALDDRLKKVQPVFEQAGLGALMPEVFEVYRTFSAPFPASKPAAAILVHFDGTGMSSAQYDQVVAELEKVSGKNFPAGQLFHLAYTTPGGINVIDIWESAEKFQAFGAILMPILQRAGVAPPTPAVYSLYNYVLPKK